jgi:hypothetical protein
MEHTGGIRRAKVKNTEAQLQERKEAERVASAARITAEAMPGRVKMGAGFSAVMMQALLLTALILAIGGRVTYAAEDFSFVVMGDSRCDRGEKTCTATTPGVHRAALIRVLNAAASHNPEFIVFTGDMVYGIIPDNAIGQSVTTQLKGWVKLMDNGGFSLNQIMPVWGSHERGFSPEDGVWTAWKNVFNPAGNNIAKRFDPEGDGKNCFYPSASKYGYFGNTVYYCDYQNARFFVLNNDIVCSNPKDPNCRTIDGRPRTDRLCTLTDPPGCLEHELGVNQLEWLKAQLVTNPKPLNFFIQHESAYGTCAHAQDNPDRDPLAVATMDNKPGKRNEYIEAIAPYATMIFSAHEHQYSRRRINASLYTQIGSGENTNIAREFLEVKPGTAGSPLYQRFSDKCTDNLEAYADESDIYYYTLITVDNSGAIPIVHGKTYAVKISETGPGTEIDSFSYPPETPLVQLGDSWRYFKGTEEPSDPITAWRVADFNDRGDTWFPGCTDSATTASGFDYGTGIGYGDGDDCEELVDMQGSYSSIYMRRAFSVANPEAISQLTLAVDYDDGFVAYINGKEVARANVTGSPPLHDTLADDAVPSDGDDGHEARGWQGLPPVQFPLDPSVLDPGRNVLAIQGHNRSRGSGDFSLIPSLRATRSPFLLVSTVAEGTNPKPLQGAAVRQGESVYLLVAPEEGIEAITYYLELGTAQSNLARATMARSNLGTGTVVTAVDGSFTPFELDTDLEPGEYTVLTIVEFQDGRLPEHISATFRVTLPCPTGFTAYNDLAWSTGQRDGNITKITSPNGDSGLPNSGNLVDFETGDETCVTLTVEGGEFEPDPHASQGRNPTTGDAFTFFSGKVDGQGAISYIDAPNSNLVLTFAGLDPDKTYTLVFYADRNRYGWDRASLAEISDVDEKGFVNASSVNKDPDLPLFMGPSDPSTRLPADNDNGYVARFTDIVPGDDGDIVLTIKWDGVPAQAYRGKYANAVMLQEE